MTHEQILEAFDEMWRKENYPPSGTEVGAFIISALKAERKAALQEARGAMRKYAREYGLDGAEENGILSAIDKLIGEGEDYPQQKVAVSRTTG